MVKPSKRRAPNLEQQLVVWKPTNREEKTKNIELNTSSNDPKDTTDESTLEQWLCYANGRFLTRAVNEQGNVLLLLPDCFHDGSRQIFDFSTGDYYKLYLPQSYGFRCCGSSERWLIMTHDFLKLTFLLHPYSRAQIHLPLGSTIPVIPKQCHVPMVRQCYTTNGRGPYFIRKAIVSSSWSSTISNQDCVVAAIDTSGKLFFCRPGDEHWVSFNDDHFEDIISYKGYFFGIDRYGLIVTFDLGLSPRATVWHMTPLPVEDAESSHTKYLVESSGQLLMVSRTSFRYFDEYRNTYAYMSTGFCVYKLDHSICPTWIKVENLGNRMLFVGGVAPILFGLTILQG